MTVIILLIILIILIFILVTLIMDEQRSRSSRLSNGKVTGYWDGSERRVDVRIETILKTKYSIARSPQKTRDSRSKNISTGGVLIEMCEKLQPPTLLVLEIFILEEFGPVMATGEIIWSRELTHKDNSGRRLFDSGIKFVSMSPGDKEKLDKQIRVLS